MSGIRSIAILLHSGDRKALKVPYRVWILARAWKEMGVRVDVVRGPRRRIDADLLLPHINLSVIPDDYWEVIQRHPRVVNRHVRDITKRSFSTHLVRPGDGYEGPVIVKTNLNCGGAPERQIYGPTMEKGDPFQLLRRAWTRLLRSAKFNAAGLLSRTRSIPSHSYPVFASVRDLPPEVFANEHLIVQRFLPERDGDRFVTRLWTFFGDHDSRTRWLSHSPCVKREGGLKEKLGFIPDKIVEARRRLGLDYAKLDFVIHEGEPVLLDVNTTPTTGPQDDPERYRRLKGLAEGIEFFERESAREIDRPAAPVPPDEDRIKGGC